MKNRQGFPHRPLIEAEKELREGQGIFRISFWQDEEALRRHLPISTNTQAIVVQRVRADCAFLAHFRKDVDDALEGSAFLFWRVDERSEAQEWSEQYLPIDELEVLDVDGQWRPYEQAELTMAEDQRFLKQGFQPLYYGTQLGSIYKVFFASTVLTAQASEHPQLAIMIHELPNTPSLLSYRTMLLQMYEHVAARAFNIPLKQIGLYLYRPSRHTFEQQRLIKLQLSEQWSSPGSGWFSPRRPPTCQIVFRDGFDVLDLHTGVGRAIKHAFGILTVKEQIAVYDQALRAADLARENMVFADDEMTETT
ncbi:hypothetical protein [Pseudoduganella rhizocola]|uniref:hypothetical protein n=1 Tax=Pseudoduganella rhizocola TaxID=3382643 RepID=UPI0038B4F4AA